MKKTEKKAKETKKVAVNDLEVGKVTGGVEGEDPKGGSFFDTFIKIDSVQKSKGVETFNKATPKLEPAGRFGKH